MKKISSFLIILIFISACKSKRNNNYDVVIGSDNDTIKVSQYLDELTRIVSYKNSSKQAIGEIVVWDKTHKTVGLLRDHKYEGRFYILDTNNIIQVLEYFINNQKVYSFNTRNTFISSQDVFDIMPDNIRYIKPPQLEYKEIDSKRVRVKLYGVNYPFVLSMITTSDPNFFQENSFKRNIAEESEEFIIRINERPVQLNFGYVDKKQKTIKSFVWKSSDGDIVFKEVKK